MARIRAGEPGAFAELVKRYQRSVLNVAYRYTGNRADAEELAQDAFLRVYRARDRYEPQARFETWLYRILFNLCANAAAYKKHRRARSLDRDAEGGRSPGGDLPAPNTESPESMTLRREMREKVKRAIMRLPEQQRRALVLSRYRGMQYQEVARVLGTSEQAIKSLLFRARENLRAALAPYLEAPPETRAEREPEG